MIIMPRKGKRRASSTSILHKKNNDSVKKKEDTNTLTLEEIDFLKNNTGFTEKEIKEWYRLEDAISLFFTLSQ